MRLHACYVYVPVKIMHNMVLQRFKFLRLCHSATIHEHHVTYSLHVEIYVLNQLFKF